MANIQKVCHFGPGPHAASPPHPKPRPTPPPRPAPPSKACRAALKEGCKQCFGPHKAPGMLAAFEAHNKPTPPPTPPHPKPPTPPSPECFKKCMANIQKVCHFGPGPHAGAYYAAAGLRGTAVPDADSKHKGAVSTTAIAGGVGAACALAAAAVFVLRRREHARRAPAASLADGEAPAEGGKPVSYGAAQFTRM